MISRIRLIIYSLVCLSLLTNCTSWNNASKGAFWGSIGGTILGAGLGAAIDGDRGADIGSDLGMALGTIAGAGIGAGIDDEQAKTSAQQQAASTQDENVFVDSATGKKYMRLTQQNDIVFKSRSTDLDDQSVRAISDISAFLMKNNQEIYIYGSTDDIESRDMSMQLSEDRALVVARLLSTFGINAARMHVKGLGATCPIADNSTMDGRAMNRCVEIYIAK